MASCLRNVRRYLVLLPSRRALTCLPVRVARSTYEHAMSMSLATLKALQGESELSTNLFQDAVKAAMALKKYQAASRILILCRRLQP